MNDEGMMAFRADLRPGGAGVFTGNGGPIATIADTSGPFSAFHGLPVINREGAVVFRADLARGGQGIYTGRGGPVTAIAETGDIFADLALFPAINDEGTVAFAATLRSGRSGIFAADSRGTRPLVEADGQFESFRGALINRAGLAAFIATPRGGRLGVFGGPDPAAGRIVCLGDPLLGSTVTDLALNPVSVNEAAQVSVRVALADGREAILRVDPVA
jgi:hypothetical protein